MNDLVRDFTDDELERLEKRLRAVYGQAAEEMTARLEDHLQRFDADNERWRQAVAEGRATAEEWADWRRGVSVEGRWVADMAADLSDSAVNVDVMARDIVNDTIPTVYAHSADLTAYQIERDIGWMTHSFDLVNEDAVRELVTMGDEDQLIHEVIPVGPPKPRVQSLRVNLDRVRDVRWNRQKFHSAITQSVLQGESIPRASARLMNVLNMDETMAIRAARTALTAAENMGRAHSYDRAVAMGIDMKQQWLATHDERTRSEHRALDGQIVNVGEPFEIDGYELMYPADPAAPPYLTYNCRCGTQAYFDDVQDPEEWWTVFPEGMTHEEWRAAAPRPRAGAGGGRSRGRSRRG